MIELKNGAIKLWVPDIEEVEPQALDQLKQSAEIPILGGHIAVMPDVHYGRGSTVGSVVPTVRAIVPSMVGVDIGCGVQSFKTNLKAEDLPDSLLSLRNSIERSIPVGFNYHKNSIGFANDKLERKRKKLFEDFENTAVAKKYEGYRHLQQLGTLGSGNHFISLLLDEEANVWGMLHSGSRNVGLTIAEYHISIAQQLAEMDGIKLPGGNKDLAWLHADNHPDEYAAYVYDLSWAQEYARLNRELMVELYLKDLQHYFKKRGKPVHIVGDVINCHHNFIEWNFEPGVHITRKGAVSAREGEWGVIPAAMGMTSYIVRGKGNPASYCSCSHGAGRKMSRGKAKKLFTLQDLEEQTKGVECRKDVGVLDEIPAAYKDIQGVIGSQLDLIEVVHSLKEIMCIKG